MGSIDVFNAARLYAEICKLNPYWNESFSLEQSDTATRIACLIENVPHCFDADCFPAHITGSGLVIDRSFSRMILLHHRKLNLWLQPGGHSDGECLTDNVARREVMEECGFQNPHVIRWWEDAVDLNLYRKNSYLAASWGVPIPFDADIHAIPARGETPSHFHFDLRYLFLADDTEAIVVSEESRDVRWVDFSAIEEFGVDGSVRRLRDKARAMLARLNVALVVE